MKYLLITALLLTSSSLWAQTYTQKNWQHFQNSQQQKRVQQAQQRNENLLRQVHPVMPPPQIQFVQPRRRVRKCVTVDNVLYCR